MSRKTVMALALALVFAFLVSAGAQAAKGGGGKPPKDPTATPTTAPEPTATPVPCTDCPAIFVRAVHVAGWQNATGGTTEANCRVVITDTDDPENQIEGATVDVTWSGAYQGTDSGLTVDYRPDAPVQALFYTPEVGAKCKGKNPSVVFTCEVTNVSHPDYTYTPSLNFEDSDSDDACRL